MNHIALFEPEIPQNVGNIIRTTSCFGFCLDIIHPIGFVFDNKFLKRSAMDYMTNSRIIHHNNYNDFFKKYEKRRIILLDTKGSFSINNFKFFDDDIFLFGKESTGVSQDIFNKVSVSLFIPIKLRSLNLSVSVGIVCNVGSNNLLMK